MAKESGSKAARTAKSGTTKKPAATAGARAAKPRAQSAAKPAKKPATSAKKPAPAAKKPAEKKPSTKAAKKPAPKSAKKPDAKPSAKAAAKPTPKPNAKAPVKTAAKPAAKPPAKPASKPGAKSPKPFTVTDKHKKKPARTTEKAPAEPKQKKSDAPVRTTVPIDVARDAAARMRESAGLALVKTDASSEPDATTRRSRTSKTLLTKNEMEEYRKLLITKRGEIVGDVSAMETEALTGGGSGSLSNLPQHMADQGSDAYDQSLSLDLAASQRKLLKEIDDALDRIAKGTYGVCEVTGKPIGKARLDAKPWAKHSIEAARQLEYRPYTR